ncbi:hypothetical protein MRB53_037945 [Persea americana]|nr:hypothetical protein MRB53_037945 [Persea americana]
MAAAIDDKSVVAMDKQQSLGVATVARHRAGHPFRSPATKPWAAQAGSHSSGLGDESAGARHKDLGETYDAILSYSDPNTFASLVVLNRSWWQRSASVDLYLQQISRCLGVSGSVDIPDGLSKQESLGHLRRMFAKEAERHLFAVWRPRCSAVTFDTSQESQENSMRNVSDMPRLVSSSSGTFLVGLSNSRIFLLNVGLTKPVVVAEVETANIPALATVSDDGRRVIVLFEDFHVVLYHVQQTSLLSAKSFDIASPVHDITLSPDGMVLAIAHDTNIELVALALEQPTLMKRLVSCSGITSIRFSRDGSALLGTTAGSIAAVTVSLNAMSGYQNSRGESGKLEGMWMKRPLFPNAFRHVSHAALISGYNGVNSRAFVLKTRSETWEILDLSGYHIDNPVFQHQPIVSHASPAWTLPAVDYSGGIVAVGAPNELCLFSTRDRAAEQREFSVQVDRAVAGSGSEANQGLINRRGPFEGTITSLSWCDTVEDSREGVDHGAHRLVIALGRSSLPMASQAAANIMLLDFAYHVSVKAAPDQHVVELRAGKRSQVVQSSHQSAFSIHDVLSSARRQDPRLRNSLITRLGSYWADDRPWSPSMPRSEASAESTQHDVYEKLVGAGQKAPEIDREGHSKVSTEIRGIADAYPVSSGSYHPSAPAESKQQVESSPLERSHGPPSSRLQSRPQSPVISPGPWSPSTTLGPWSLSTTPVPWSSGTKSTALSPQSPVVQAYSNSATPAEIAAGTQSYPVIEREIYVPSVAERPPTPLLHDVMRDEGNRFSSLVIPRSRGIDASAAASSPKPETSPRPSYHRNRGSSGDGPFFHSRHRRFSSHSRSRTRDEEDFVASKDTVIAAQSAIEPLSPAALKEVVTEAERPSTPSAADTQPVHELPSNEVHELDSSTISDLTSGANGDSSNSTSESSELETEATPASIRRPKFQSFAASLPPEFGTSSSDSSPSKAVVKRKALPLPQMTVHTIKRKPLPSSAKASERDSISAGLKLQEQNTNNDSTYRKPRLRTFSSTGSQSEGATTQNLAGKTVEPPQTPSETISERFKFKQQPLPPRRKSSWKNVIIPSIPPRSLSADSRSKVIEAPDPGAAKMSDVDSDSIRGDTTAASNSAKLPSSAQIASLSSRRDVPFEDAPLEPRSRSAPRAALGAGRRIDLAEDLRTKRLPTSGNSSGRNSPVNTLHGPFSPGKRPSINRLATIESIGSLRSLAAAQDIDQQRPAPNHTLSAPELTQADASSVAVLFGARLTSQSASDLLEGSKALHSKHDSALHVPEQAIDEDPESDMIAEQARSGRKQQRKSWSERLRSRSRSWGRALSRGRSTTRSIGRNSSGEDLPTLNSLEAQALAGAQTRRRRSWSRSLTSLLNRFDSKIDDGREAYDAGSEDVRTFCPGAVATPTLTTRSSMDATQILGGTSVDSHHRLRRDSRSISGVDRQSLGMSSPPPDSRRGHDPRQVVSSNDSTDVAGVEGRHGVTEQTAPTPPPKGARHRPLSPESNKSPVPATRPHE